MYHSLAEEYPFTIRSSFTHIMAAVIAATRPWLGVGAAIWVQVAAGNAYNFPLYSHSLKSVLGFNQRQLALLGVANDVGENFGLVAAYIYNRFPPWVVVLIGALACLVGYGSLWLALTQTVSLPFWLLWFALAIATNSNAWFTTAVLVTNMRNFPWNRGIVSGVIKGYGGLSGAVYTAIYSVLLDNSSSQLLLFLTFGVPLLCLMLMCLVRPCPPAARRDISEQGHFRFIQACSVVLGICVLTTTILDDSLTLRRPVAYSLLAFTVLLLMAPLAIPLKIRFDPRVRNESVLLRLDNATYAETLIAPSSPTSEESPSSPEASDNATRAEPPSAPAATDNAITAEPPSASAATDNAISAEPPETPAAIMGSSHRGNNVSMLLAEGDGAIRERRRPSRGEDFTLTEALVKADFWLLFFAYFVGVGSGVTVLNNLAQIGIAQYMHDTKILLSIFSFCNFLGRLGGGTASEYLVSSRAIPRTIWMGITQLVMMITYVVLTSAENGTLYVATMSLGICYGFQFSIMTATVSELFGLENFGMLYNFISLGNPLGAYVFSSVIAGNIYDEEAARQHSTTCLGPDCFGMTFIVLAAACVIGIILSMLLTIRIMPVYTTLYGEGSNSNRLPTPAPQSTAAAAAAAAPTPQRT